MVTCYSKLRKQSWQEGLSLGGGESEGRGGEKRNKLILKKSKEQIKTGQKEDRSVPLIKSM